MITDSEYPLNHSDARIRNAMNHQGEQLASANKKWINYRKGNELKELDIWNVDSKAKIARNHFNQTRIKDRKLENKFKVMKSEFENYIPARKAAFREATKNVGIDRLDSMMIEREFLRDRLNAKKLAKNVMKVVK